MMLQAAEKKVADARQQLAAVEHLKDTFQARSSHSTGPSRLRDAWQHCSSSWCNTTAVGHHESYPDVHQTSMRVLEEENRDLMHTVDRLKSRLQVQIPLHYPLSDIGWLRTAFLLLERKWRLSNASSIQTQPSANHVQDCVLAEQEARQMLEEARSREGMAAQRLADCIGRVHTLELMRLNGVTLRQDSLTAAHSHLLMAGFSTSCVNSCGMH
jgi:hypothetical protein